jgi:hypothetical protein
MVLQSIDVGLIAVLGAAVASMVLGALWYSPLLFGNAWMKASGMTKKDLEKAKAKGMGKSYFLSFIGAVVTAYVLAFVIRLAQVNSVGGGVKIGVLIWIGFVVPMMLGSVLWENKSKSFYFINVFYQFVNLILMSVIVTAWA